MPEPNGRKAIGVDQEPGGSHYPLLRPPEGWRQLIADMAFEYSDPEEVFATPLRIAWLYGFGDSGAFALSGIDYNSATPQNDAPVGLSTDLGSSPITPAHDYDLEIRDDNDVLIFSTLDATDYRATDWSDRLRILEWSDADHVLRLVFHTAWGPNDSPLTYPQYGEFSPGIPLDQRVLLRRGRRLESLTLGLDTFQGLPIHVRAGYNNKLLLTPAEPADGQPLNNLLEIGFPAGAGLGRFPADCGDLLTVRTIRHVPGDGGGGFTLEGAACARVEPVVHEIVQELDLDSLTPRQVNLLAHTLRIIDDCSVCYTCDDFIAVYNALRKLSDRTRALLDRAGATRDTFAEVVTRYQAHKDCREAQSLKLIADAFCPCVVGFSAGFCHRGDECLENVVIHLSFVYTDAEGSGVTANSQPQNAAILPNTTFRGGFVDPDRRETIARETYRLGGSWPNYYAHFPLVNPRQKPYVTWHMKYEDCTAIDQIELVGDAYTVDGGFVVPDYNPGEGPVGPAAYPGRLIPLPVKVSVSLLPICEE